MNIPPKRYSGTAGQAVCCHQQRGRKDASRVSPPQALEADFALVEAGARLVNYGITNASTIEPLDILEPELIAAVARCGQAGARSVGHGQGSAVCSNGPGYEPGPAVPRKHSERIGAALIVALGVEKCNELIRLIDFLFLAYRFDSAIWISS